MKRFKRVAIVGTGLIGGSLGMAIRRKRLASEVVGISRSPASVARARRSGAVDHASRSLDAIRGCDFLLLCLPVGEILRQAPRIARLVGRDCLVCDVGSTKGEITAALEKLFPNFVGCHPLAGSEKRGIAHADSRLFDGSLCVITRTRRTQRTALDKATGFWKKICGRVELMTPQEHDRVLALVSHLPHAVSYALANAVPQSLFGFAAGGFRDTTRLAGSDERLWGDIFLSNRKNSLEAIRLFEDSLNRVKSALSRGSKGSLSAELRKGRKKREQLDKRA